MSNELKAHTHIDYSLHDLVNMKFYLTADVDALLAEKDNEIDKQKWRGDEGERCGAFCLTKDFFEVKEKEFDSKLRATRRALYKACSNWAKSERYTEATWHGDEHREELWAEVQDKCLKKAEEYK